ncbi:uncharacterized protein Bfra_006163 [Botrytis fragariae]|uniref:Uncharacterized protein n=1 Tax=Botrytis fragariae TaxID=1964551 RepID=A0A8H6ASV1_9HELO|nr:uncharacterized protein Bfra_006163 [Botrytis fragariae]KAF5872800.1 hypothetical protein Bfra_006163 [Botrytis fragariae]
MTFIYLLISIEGGVLNRELRKAVISHLRRLGALSRAAADLFIYSHNQHVDPETLHLRVAFKTASLR